MDIQQQLAQTIIDNYGVSFDINQTGKTVKCIDNLGHWFYVEQLNNNYCYIGESQTGNITID